MKPRIRRMISLARRAWSVMCSRASAAEGVPEAQFQVGLMYLQGDGVEENEEEAINWLWRAANKGYPQASDVLEFIFSDDFGVGC